MPSVSERTENSDPAASVQGSVADVIQDITDDTDSSVHNSVLDNNVITTACGENDERSAILRQQIAVPLASRVSDKFSLKFGPTNT